MHPDYLQRRLRIEFDDQQVSSEQLLGKIAGIGFPAQLVIPPIAGIAVPPAADPAPYTVGLRARASTWAGGLLLVIAATVRLAIGETNTLVAALAIAATLAAGVSVVRAALRALRLWALDMNVLMSLAAVGAIATRDYFEAATAMFLFNISLWLESASLGRARRAVQTLLELTPDVAHLVGDHGEQDVPPLQIVAGDQLRVKPGERVPVDGQVVEGQSSLNQAPITGESEPVEAGPGTQIYAGSLNQEGSLLISATGTASESTLAQIARLVEQSQSQRSPTERFVNQFARRYTPAVLVLAVLIVTVPPLLAQFSVPWAMSVPASEWLHRGLVLLVIACPCALVISTPVTIVCGLHRAARRGILIKGGEFLEAAGRLRALAIDKTGTLTTGRMQVVRVAAERPFSETEVLQRAAALERSSEHPLATAIVAAAVERGLSPLPITDFLAVRGLGVQGVMDGQLYQLGNERLQPTASWAEDAADAAYTMAVLTRAGQRLGTIYLADAPRDDAAQTIRELKSLGIRPIVMLTGDRIAVAQAVGQQLGVDQVLGGLLPQDKVDAIQTLKSQYPELAMVGDGVNDAPALAAAGLGIAWGAQASATALETADVVIMSSRFSRLVELVRLGRRCRRLLRQNITLALAIKAGVLLLAALGWGTMWMAVAADVGASLLVIFNGMRLLQGSNET